MLRRMWLTSLVGLLAAQRAAQAQPAAKVFRIGLLGGSSPTSPEASHVWAGFFEGLRELGYVEGRNFVVEGRFYGDSVERLPALAAELVRLPVDVIVAAGPPAPEAAKRATSTIPIVMPNHGDPLGTGLVASLARPGGNVTGLSILSLELRLKQLQLLKEVVPNLSRVAVLWLPTIPLHKREMETGARALKLQLQFIEVRDPGEFAGAFGVATKERAGALVAMSGSMFFAHRAQLAGLAIRHRLPSMYLNREYAEAGALITYGVDLRDGFRRAAAYVDKILKGAKPGDLPIEQPTKFELAINLKTAKALGLTIPSSVLVRADRIIE